jgi:hypothetical protein
MLHVFLHSLRSRWFEYLVAAGVVATVVAAFVVQRSLSTSAERQVHDLVHRLGKNMLVVPEETDLSRFYTLHYDDEAMPESYVSELRSSKPGRHIKAIQSCLYGNIEMGGVPLVLVGQSITPTRAQYMIRPSQAILGPEAGERLGLRAGDEFTVGGVELTVARVAPSVPEGLDMAMFTDLGTAQAILSKPGEINAMRLAGCWCSTDVPALAADVEGQLPGVRAITVAGTLRSQQGSIATVKRYSRIFYAVALVLIAGITSVLVLSQVRRQVREVGLLLAVGAPPSAVALIFVAMAGLIGLVGGVAGYLLGHPLTDYATTRIMGQSMPVPGGILAPALLLTVAVSVISAFLPAARAARLDPTRVLREV